MATGIGFKSIMGCGKQSAYRTGVTVTDRLPFMSEGISWDFQQVLHEYMYGGSGTLSSQRISEPVSGSIELAVPYTVLDSAEFVSASLPIAMAFGNTAYDGTEDSNQITLKDDLDVFGTFAWDKGQDGTYPWELVGGLVNSLSLTCSAGDSLKASLEVMGYELVIDSNAVNAITDLSSLPTDTPTLALFSDMTFRVNQQGSALSSSDDVGISEITVSVTNNMTDYEASSPDNSSSHTDSKKTIQPIRNGMREITLEFSLPRYESDYFFDRLSSDNNLQASINFDDPTSTGYIEILIPNFKVESVSASVGGSGAVTQTVSCRCFKRNSASDVAFADASTDNGEVWIETKDERTASIL